MQDGVLGRVPTMNRNVVAEEYYGDRLKGLGKEVGREKEKEDGFMGYAELWKRKVRKGKD